MYKEILVWNSPESIKASKALVISLNSKMMAKNHWPNKLYQIKTQSKKWLVCQVVKNKKIKTSKIKLYALIKLSSNLETESNSKEWKIIH